MLKKHAKSNKILVWLAGSLQQGNEGKIIGKSMVLTVLVVSICQNLELEAGDGNLRYLLCLEMILICEFITTLRYTPTNFCFSTDFL